MSEAFRFSNFYFKISDSDTRDVTQIDFVHCTLAWMSDELEDEEVCTRNSPKRALNDCRRLDVKPASCWRSKSHAVNASLNNLSLSKCSKLPVSISTIKTYSLFSNANTCLLKG